MKFCSECGAPVVLRVPEGDSLPRHVCDACHTIHYSNPKMVVGTIPEYDGRVLLCRRAIEPRHGLWTLPAGFMENDETIAEAAARETREEANAVVEMMDLFAVLDVRHVNQVHIFFRARLPEPRFGPGAESLEVGLFDEREIPWRDMAFATVYHTLERFFEDRRRRDFHVHTADITRTDAWLKTRR